MLRELRTATMMLLALTVLTGAAYPWAVGLIAQAVFPRQAEGSLIRRDGKAVGSELIGQSFTKPEYFWGRLSATAPVPYNAASSGGSNFGLLNPGLKAAAESRIAALRAAGSKGSKVPVDLATASGSGLDPEISPAAAEFQAPRVAAARNLSEEVVRELIQRHTTGRQFGLLGEPRVNVLRLNLALDQQSQKKL